MQSASFTLASPSPSLSLLKHRRQPPSLSFNPRFDPIRASSSSNLNNDSFNVNLSTRRSWSLSSSSSSSSPIKLRPWNAPLPSYSDAGTNRFEVKATSVPEAAGEKPESSSLFKTLELGALFGLWYLFNIYFNIYNKQVRFRFDSLSKNLRLRICVCVCVKSKGMRVQCESIEFGAFVCVSVCEMREGYFGKSVVNGNKSQNALLRVFIYGPLRSINEARFGLQFCLSSKRNFF